ncbi:MAG: hypothetical protein AB7I18_07870 [Candidatus Berkiella sp.]
MIGTPISFSQNEMTLHRRMCTLLKQCFGKLPVTKPIVLSGIKLQGKPLSTILAMLEKEFDNIASVTSQQLEYSADLPALMADLNITDTQTKKAAKSTSRKQPATTTHNKKEAYESFHRRLSFCTTTSTLLFQELYFHKDLASIQTEQPFHHVCSYFMLLAAICNLNMAIYQTHPVHETLNRERISALFKSSHNWIMLLESYHLNYGQGEDYTNLRKLFVTRTIDFQNQFYQNPDWVDLFPEEMKLPLSPEELEYHVAQKNQRAKLLGLPFDGHVIMPQADTLYVPSNANLTQLYEAMRSICLNESMLGRRAQFLFYYNAPYGNVDIVDVRLNPDTQTLEIINIHTGNSCAHHEFLLQLYGKLASAKLPFQLLACQADLGQRTQNTAAYALKISSLLSKIPFGELLAKAAKRQPTFSDEAHASPQTLYHIPEIGWFPVSALGDKAMLLDEKAATLPALQAKMPEYTAKYALSDMIGDDPDTASHYVDYYRRRLAHRHFSQNAFATLTYDELKKKLQPKDDAHMLRLAATERASTREFQFLVEHFKKNHQEQCLHERAAESGFTPLLWTLKKNSPKKAAILLNATSFEAAELTSKDNKDKKSPQDYFAGAKERAVRKNPVLRKFLKPS